MNVPYVFFCRFLRKNPGVLFFGTGGSFLRSEDRSSGSRGFWLLPIYLAKFSLSKSVGAEGGSYRFSCFFGQHDLKSVIFELQRRNFCTIIASECTSSIFLPFFDKNFQSAFFRPTGILSPWDFAKTTKSSYERIF